MNASRARTRSLWMDTKVAPGASRLEQDTSADVVVVGSGIAGLSTAYELAAEGQKVVVLDRGPIGGGITARTTAHLTSLCDESFATLIDVRGVDIAKEFSDQDRRLPRRKRQALPEIGRLHAPWLSCALEFA